MLILGIDPGLGTTGYGAITVSDDDRSIRLVEGGVLRTDASLPLEARLAQLHADVAEVLGELIDKRERPASVAVEALYTKYDHPRTAIVMGHARGVILLAAAERSIPVATYQASRVKLAITGSGAAPKAQVARTVQRILALSEPPTPADVTDALAIAICHANAVMRGRIVSK